MNDRTSSRPRLGPRHRLAALGLSALALIAACGGGSAPPPAGANGDAGTDPEAGSPAAAIAAAWDRVASSAAIRYRTTFVARGGGIEVTSSATVTARTSPVEASRFEFASDGGSGVHLIHDGRLWLDGGDGRLVDVGEPTKSIADQQEPYAIESLWEDIERQLDDYELVGTANVDGQLLTHYRLDEHRREQAAEGYRVDPDQFSGDVWLDQDGNLRRMFRGMVEGKNGTPDRYDSTTVEVLDLDCACPVEPPAAS